MNALGSDKLLSLYHSLHSVSGNTNPALLTVGAWCFLEVVARSLNSQNPFSHHFTNRINNDWYPNENKDIKKKYVNALNYIHEEGNSSKHCNEDFNADTKNLSRKFATLEPIMLKALDELIINKK